MKILKTVIILSVIFVTILIGYSIYKLLINYFQTLPVAVSPTNIPEMKVKRVIKTPSPSAAPTKESNLYQVYVNEDFKKSFKFYDDALEYADTFEHASIRQNKSRNGEWLWDNYPKFHVFTGKSKGKYEEFNSFTEALAYAKSDTRSFVYLRKNNMLVWTNASHLMESHKIEDVPLISQLPELQRGCEVTSLAMLLNFHGVSVSKLTLADEIDKVAYRTGKLYGNPHEGFVGDIWSMSKDGYGVYHEPIYKLLTKYKKDTAYDITGLSFDDILRLVSTDFPVWIITNSSYSKLARFSETWKTNDGDVQITWNEHSVLITGYDEKYIYFNDPLVGETRASRKGFIEAWEQMGSQAVTVFE